MASRPSTVSRAAVIQSIRRAAHALGHLPSRAQVMAHASLTDPDLRRHFAAWSQALCAAGLVPPIGAADPRARAPGRARPTVLGRPMTHPHFRNEPVNEQGVVLLFGMMAAALGFVVEVVRTEFPDCEALRQVAPGRWQRVRVEFELNSRAFAAHGHDASACDIIVCWRHNWPRCPARLEVIELSSRLPKP